MIADKLRIFCDTNTGPSQRFDLSQPFIQDSRVYATDGTMMAWVELDSYLGPPLTIKDRPNMTRIAADWVEPTNDWWNGSVPDCDYCKNTGSIEISKCRGCTSRPGKCSECEGTGQMECHCCGQDTDCDECDGDGVCPVCEGSGAGTLLNEECWCCRDIRVKFGNISIRGLMARRLAKLGGIKWVAINDRIAFRSRDGICGIAMGLRD